MEQIELAGTSRTVEKTGARRLRQAGKVPGIVYGHGFDSIPLHFGAMELKRILAQAGASRLINLRIDGASSTQPVLAREIQRDVLTGVPTHIDFLAVSMTEKITAEVPITLVGVPAVVARSEGLLLHGASTVEIECLPGDLIPSLEVDVSNLEMDGTLYVSDLRPPAGIVLLSDPQEMVARVVHERLALEGEELEVIAEPAAEVEVIGRGKPKEEVVED